MDNIITMKEQIQLFEDRKVRTVWDGVQEKWYFSIVDVVEVLTDSADPTSHTPPVIPCLTRNLIIRARPGISHPQIAGQAGNDGRWAGNDVSNDLFLEPYGKNC